MINVINLHKLLFEIGFINFHSKNTIGFVQIFNFIPIHLSLACIINELNWGLRNENWPFIWKVFCLLSLSKINFFYFIMTCGLQSEILHDFIFLMAADRDIINFWFFLHYRAVISHNKKYITIIVESGEIYFNNKQHWRHYVRANDTRLFI